MVEPVSISNCPMISCPYPNPHPKSQSPSRLVLRWWFRGLSAEALLARRQLCGLQLAQRLHAHPHPLQPPSAGLQATGMGNTWKPGLVHHENLIGWIHDTSWSLGWLWVKIGEKEEKGWLFPVGRWRVDQSWTENRCIIGAAPGKGMTCPTAVPSLRVSTVKPCPQCVQFTRLGKPWFDRWLDQLSIQWIIDINQYQSISSTLLVFDWFQHVSTCFNQRYVRYVRYVHHLAGEVRRPLRWDPVPGGLCPGLQQRGSPRRPKQPTGGRVWPMLTAWVWTSAISWIILDNLDKSPTFNAHFIGNAIKNQRICAVFSNKPGELVDFQELLLTLPYCDLEAMWYR